MAEADNPVRRRVEVPERFEYRKALENVVNFVHNELGNERAPQQRPDDTDWRIQRAKTIRTLNELRRKLDTVCVSANYGKVTGNGAEIAGAVISIGGAIMALAGVPVASLINNIGNLVHHSGNLADGVSNVVESIVSAKYLGEIEKELQRDKKLSKPLEKWLDYSRNLDANVQALFGVSLASKKWITIMETFYEFSKFCVSARGFNETVNLMKQGRYSVYIGNDVKLEKLKMIFQLLSDRPEFADKVRVALSVLCVSTVAIQVARDGVQVYQNIMGVTDLVVPSLQGGCNIEVPTAGAMAGYCFFQAISIAISVVSLINAASIIRNGTSKYSDSLKQLTRSLAWELRRMEDL